jgi:hypothetical protein
MIEEREENGKKKRIRKKKRYYHSSRIDIPTHIVHSIQRVTPNTVYVAEEWIALHFT